MKKIVAPHYGKSKSPCVVCNKSYEFIPIWGNEGPWCMGCFGESCYDGLTRRTKPLTLLETRKRRYIYPNIELNTTKK